jgi:hypothetical protein
MQAILPIRRRRTKMKNSLIYSVIPAIALALAISTPASAQLLGGGGGLTGGLGGGAGGSIGRTTGTVTGSTTGSIRGEKKIDRKAGRVSGNGQAQGSSAGTAAANNAATTGSADASKSGSIDAQLVGTDFVRGTGEDAAARGRGAAETVRGTAGSAAGSARSAAGSASGSASGAGSIAGSGSAMGSGMASGGMGQLVTSGSFAASKSGSFAIEPGMPIEDAKGRTIGYVQSVKQTKQGVIEAVTVETGNRMATLPAASFSGQGDALVTGMSKGEMTSVAKQQQKTQPAQGSNAAPAMTETGPQDNAGNNTRAPSGVRSQESNNVKEN